MVPFIFLSLLELSAWAIQLRSFPTKNVTNSSNARALIVAEKVNDDRVKSIYPEGPDGDDKFFKILQDVYGKQYFTSRSAAHGLSQKEKDNWAKIPANRDDKFAHRATYGEITPKGIRSLLQTPEVRADANAKFFDLGAGDGKAVMVAWLMGLQATGIELVEKRFDESCRALNEVEKLHKPWTASSMLRFYKGSFTDLSFSDADIVFMNNVCWQEDMMKRIATEAKELKKGARIITSKPLEGNDFNTLATKVVPVSWGDKPHEYTIQEKVSDIYIPVDPPQSLEGVSAKDHCEL